MFPSGVARPFATIVRYQDVYELGVLEPGQSIADSLTLLRGQEGALFPSAGIFQIIVNVSWVEDGIPAMVSGETMVLITQPVSEEHAKAAKLIRGEEIDNPVRKEMAEVLLSKAGQLDMTDDIQTILAKHKVWQGGLFPAATNISVERVPSCYQFSHYNIEPEKRKP